VFPLSSIRDNDIPEFCPKCHFGDADRPCLNRCDASDDVLGSKYAARTPRWAECRAYQRPRARGPGATRLHCTYLAELVFRYELSVEDVAHLLNNSPGYKHGGPHAKFEDKVNTKATAARKIGAG
jgi:hypothetical protein